MRLGQISRKLNVKPNDIRDFIESEFKVRIELDLNFKLDDNQIAALNENFKQTDPVTISATTNTVASPVVEDDLNIQEEEASIVDEIEPITVEVKDEKSEEEVAPNEESKIVEIPGALSDPFEPVPVNPDAELIKAPKIKLEGLKVVGKIELPEKNIKVEEIVANETGEDANEAVASDEALESNFNKKKPIIEPLIEEEYSIYKDKNGIYHFSQQQKENRKNSLDRIALKKLEKQKRKNKAKHYQKIATVAKKENLSKKKAKKVASQRQKVAVVKPVRKGIWGKFLNWLND